MNYTQLGISDITLSEISFGCMSLSPNRDFGEIKSLISEAKDQGINFFDTADRYDHGKNEEMLGKAVQGFREDVILSSKVGHVWNSNQSAWEWKPTGKHILRAIDESLERLQTDYLDLYMLHGGTLEDPIDDIIEAFETLKRTGKIRAYGISSIRPNVIRQYVSRSNIDCVMMQYSLLDRRPEEFCLDYLKEHRVSVLARGTLAKGLLADKAPKTYLDYSEEEVSRLKEALSTAEEALAKSLHYVLANDTVGSAAIGIRNEKQLRDNLNAFSTEIHSEEIEQVSNILEPNFYQKHR